MIELEDGNAGRNSAAEKKAWLSPEVTILDASEAELLAGIPPDGLNES